MAHERIGQSWFNQRFPGKALEYELPNEKNQADEEIKRKKR
jgi:hypothetical protein